MRRVEAVCRPDTHTFPSPITYLRSGDKETRRQGDKETGSGDQVWRTSSGGQALEETPKKQLRF